LKEELMIKRPLLKVKYLECISCILLFIIYSCDDSPNEADQSYFPLQVGNSWTYRYGTWTYSGEDTTRIFTYTITEKKQINGREYFAFDYRMPFFPSIWVFPDLGTPFLRQNDTGNISIVIDSTEWTFLKFERVTIDSIYKLQLNDVDYWIKIKSISDTVETPIGVFKNCLKMCNYYPQIKDTIYYIWFARGYGPVKIYYPSVGTIFELIDIEIK